MANTLTALAPLLFSAARIVPKELTGLLGASDLNFDDKGVAAGQTVTVPVMPTTCLGEDSFGWGYFQEPQAMLVSSPDSNNPLNLYNSIGGKVTLGVTRFEDQPGYIRIARVESAISN